MATTEEKPVKKEVEVSGEEEEEESDDDECPALEAAPDVVTAAAGATDAAAAGHQSRSEKKSRKAMAKMGLKPVPGVRKVTIRKAKNILFVISNPDVHKNPTTGTYIIFGEAKIEDLGSEAKRKLVDQLNTGAAFPSAPAAAAAATGAPSDAQAPAADAAADDEEVDTTGIEENDITLVSQQAHVSRGRAAKALRHNNNDIVSAIMELTT